MRARHPTRHASAASAAPSPADLLPDDLARRARLRERPDGWHWVDESGRQEFGPFETVEEALADMEAPTTGTEAALAEEEANVDGLDLGEPAAPTDDEEFGDRG